jgi:hypothetical protein
MAKYGKNYNGADYNYRLAVYLQNKEFIDTHNSSGSQMILRIN